MKALSMSVFLGFVLSGGNVGAAAEPKPTWQSEWDRTVAAAKREGMVSVYQYNPSEVFDAALFKKIFPGINVSVVSGRGGQIAHRIMTERRADKYLADVTIEGVTTNYSVFYRAKILEPIKPALLLPEVLDESRWWRGRHRYTDPEGGYVFHFLGVPQAGTTFYNTQLVNPKEFTSLWDFVQSRWRGKIAARDVRSPGHGQGALRFFYYHPELGPKFIKRLFGEMEITLFRDIRQGVDWLASRKFAICFGCGIREINQAKRQGLPVERFGHMKEGAGLTTYAGTLALLNRAPHPNAAKVFINWFLSREGQLSLDPGDYSPDSLRIDISKERVAPDDRRQEGVRYLDLDTPERADMKPAIKVLEEALAEAKQK